MLPQLFQDRGNQVDFSFLEAIFDKYVDEILVKVGLMAIYIPQRQDGDYSERIALIAITGLTTLLKH